MDVETTKQELRPIGTANPEHPYFIYQRKKHGLWITLNMGILYGVLIAIGILVEEYPLLGFTILISLGLIYDQLTNPQFLEITGEQIRYRLPRKTRGEINISSLQKVTLSPTQILLDLGQESPTEIEINALLSPKKKKELRAFVKEQFKGILEVER